MLTRTILFPATLFLAPLLLVSPAALAEPATAQPGAQQADGVETFQLEGRIGTYPVGMSLAVRDHRIVVRGRYFYASRLVDIPLDIAGPNDPVVLTEPGGGRFVLHLQNSDAATARPLTFYTATGLAGSWTQGSVNLPVSLGITTVYTGFGPERRYGDVTTASDAAFEARVRQFIDGVIGNDRKRAMAAVSFPLRLNGQPAKIIRDRAVLLAGWDRIFTPAVIASLRRAVPHDMFVRDGMAMVGNGLVWFDARGARVLNLP